MTIAYNSAYVQTETLNFAFAWQAIMCILMQNAEHLCRPTSRLFFVNNVGLYINSQQTINTNVAYFVWVTIIWRFLTVIWQ